MGYVVKKMSRYFYGRRQGNGCEIQFRGLLQAREVLISRTVAHKINLKRQIFLFSHLMFENEC
jgi:hypothetical protein